MGNRVMYYWYYAIVMFACATLAPRDTVIAQSTNIVAATPAEWHARHVTIEADALPLATVLHMIAQQAGLTPGYAPALITRDTRVTLRLRDVPVDQAFVAALRGTGLVAQIRPNGNVTIAREVRETTAPGSIAGRVTDAASGRALAGVKIGLDDRERVTETDADGRYRMDGVGAGVHTVHVRLIGYSRIARTVTVGEGTTSTIDVALTTTAMALDQVVVTGTIIPTELKAVPNAITVITAKQIEERGITKIDQLFRGDVPGLFAMNQGSLSLLDEVSMFSRGATALSSLSSGTDLNTNPIKTYIDGVELADPKYLSQIDPKSIERIEILTGPQASTIYGSNAINGVMQIFTKRGTSATPQLTLNLLSGWVENNFSSALTPQHDYGVQLDGMEGRLSYNGGGSWNYIGPWTPAKQTTRINGFGGMRLSLPTSIGAVTANATLRNTRTLNQKRGDPSQVWTENTMSGLWRYDVTNPAGLPDAPTQYMLGGQTLGFTLEYVPTPWWSHELTLGRDDSDTEWHSTARGYRTRSDTTLVLYQVHAGRQSLRYATTAHILLSSFSQASLTAGADEWQSLSATSIVHPLVLTGTLTGQTYLARQPDHNAGGFLQGQLGVHDQLFLTYGLRAEWNPNFGANVRPNYSPRYGLAYTQEMNTPLGVITAKLRGSYGRSTRPPAPDLTAAVTLAEEAPGYVQYYGDLMARQANANLMPEHQRGGEGGLELYFGDRGTLVVTRYNQIVGDLIVPATVDSVDELPAVRTAYGDPAWAYPFYITQNLNLANIRNQGWEVQGSLRTGPLTTHGVYSWTMSRTIGVNPKYQAYIASNPAYQQGRSFRYLPEHTWSLEATYAHARSSIQLDVMGTGRTMIDRNGFALDNFDSRIRLSLNQPIVTARPYGSAINGYALADMTASHRFSTSVEWVLQMQNLTDHYTNDRDAVFAVMGRQTRTGFRIRL